MTARSDAIAALRAEGLTGTAIAKQLGLHAATVRKDLRALGITTTQTGPTRRALDAQSDTDDCILWTGSITYDGYGRVGNGTGKSPTTAQRRIWELVRGPIPDGLQIDHLCRVRACVNVRHLEPVTQVENQRRRRKTHCVRGHEFAVYATYSERAGRTDRRCGECRRRRPQLADTA